MSGNRATFFGADHILRRAEAEFWRHRPNRLPASPLYDDEFRGRVNSVPPAPIEALSGHLRLVEEDIKEIVAGILRPPVTHRAIPSSGSKAMAKSCCALLTSFISPKMLR